LATITVGEQVLGTEDGEDVDHGLAGSAVGKPRVATHHLEQLAECLFPLAAGGQEAPERQTRLEILRIRRDPWPERPLVPVDAATRAELRGEPLGRGGDGRAGRDPLEE